MTEIQIETMIYVSLVRKYLHSIRSDELQIKARNNCIKFIMRAFDCGYARACQMFSEV